MASFLVVTAHISRSLAPFLLKPTLGEHEGATLFQLPILRTFVMGRPSVAAFAILAGFVNALKPVRQTRAGQIDAALSGIAKSAYRRTGRFMMPSVVATTLSWLATQFGIYSLATIVDSNWIRDTAPRPSSSFAGAFRDLLSALRTTWTNGSNDYDKIQWTLTYLLRGSMLVYLSLFATAYVQPRYRFLIYGVLYCYYYGMGDGKKRHYHTGLHWLISRNSGNRYEHLRWPFHGRAQLLSISRSLRGETTVHNCHRLVNSYLSRHVVGLLP